MHHQNINMKRLFILGAIWALAMARPELYKEKEDFQFSRSSSDDGSKSGFYGAQRGNMGGNYERSHNMDSLAQNQMSGLVRHVEGELGDGTKTRTGSVYTAANSGGTYGSGHYDLSNLAGRNFREGTSYDDSHSQSSLSSSSAYNSAGYANSRSSSRQSGYQAAAHSGLIQQSDDLQSLEHSQGAGQYDYGRQSSQSAGYHSQSGIQQHSAYDNSHTSSQSGYGSNARTRLVSATPVRIIVRPGTRVAIPVAAQSYDVIHGSMIDQNSLNSEAEVLNNDNQRVFIPTNNNAKHYESSYNYRKEWEKHDTIPSTDHLATTVNPLPQYSELYEDSRAHTSNNQYDTSRVDSQRAHASSHYGGYIANVQSSRSNYDIENQRASSLSNSNAYTQTGYGAGVAHQGSLDSSSNGYVQTQHNAGSRYHGAAVDSNSLTQAEHKTGYNADLNSQVEDLNAKPKSYQSSYSYHKSWERQGDPYVIKPASSAAYYDGQSSQRLTGSTKTGYAASGSHYQHSHQSEADCDENGHIRVARSYNIDKDVQQSQNIEDLGQQTQVTWDQQDSGQQAQSTWDNLEDLGQQSQNKWDRIEDLTQPSQNKWDKIEDLGQQSQQTWDKFEDLGQSTQNNYDQKDFGQETLQTNQQLENLAQQTQSKW